MDIAAALKIVEERVHSTADDTDAGVEGALSSIVGSALSGAHSRRNRGGADGSNSGRGGENEAEAESEAEAEAEAEYALNVILSLTKRSDPRFQSYFSCLRSLGVSVEDLHKRVHANRSAVAFKHELFTSSPSGATALPRGGGFFDEQLRVCVDEKHWPQVMNLLFQSVLRDPTRMVEIVNNDCLDGSKESFLEVRMDKSGLGMKLCLGAENLEDPAFLVPMKVAMLSLSNTKYGGGPESDNSCSSSTAGSRAMAQLTMAQVSREAMREACYKGALSSLIPSRFALSSILCMPLTSLDNLLAWLDLLHSCDLPPSAQAVSGSGMRQGGCGDVHSEVKMLILTTGSAVYSLSLLLVWALLGPGNATAAAPTVGEETRQRVCSLLSWLCGEDQADGQVAGRRDDGAVAVMAYRRLLGGGPGEGRDGRLVASKSRQGQGPGQMQGQCGALDQEGPMPPLGACVLVCVAASALGLLTCADEGQEEGDNVSRKRGRGPSPSSPWQQVLAAARPAQVRSVASQAVAILHRPDSPLGPIVSAMLGSNDATAAAKVAAARVSAWSAPL